MPEVITDNLGLWSSALLIRSTAGRGSNNKLEAYGIKKLRELILELAVRGKLVNMRAKPYKAHLDSEYLNLYMKTEIAKIILLSHAKEAISQA